MNRNLLLLFAMLGLSSFAFAQSVREIGREDISHMVQKSGDTTYVINFWATWCSPCVREIGYFEELHREYAGDPVQVLLVSLDLQRRQTGVPGKELTKSE